MRPDAEWWAYWVFLAIAVIALGVKLWMWWRK
jgi:hypothetical protein